MVVDTEKLSLGQLQDQQYRPKKRSSDEDDSMDDPRTSKRVKSDSEEITIKKERIDIEVVDLGAMFERMRNHRHNYGDSIPSDVDWPLVNTLPLLLCSSFCGKTPIHTQSPVGMTMVPEARPSLSEQRRKQIPVWLSLVESINDARRKLQGDDLELFERLISIPRTPEQVDELIERWRGGELSSFSKLREVARSGFGRNGEN